MANFLTGVSIILLYGHLGRRSNDNKRSPTITYSTLLKKGSTEVPTSPKKTTITYPNPSFSPIEETLKNTRSFVSPEVSQKFDNCAVEMCLESQIEQYLVHQFYNKLEGMSSKSSDNN